MRRCRLLLNLEVVCWDTGEFKILGKAGGMLRKARRLWYSFYIDGIRYRWSKERSGMELEVT